MPNKEEIREWTSHIEIPWSPVTSSRV